MKPELAKDWKYWEGFADGQKDMESQLDQEKDQLNPNDFIHSLDMFSMWILSQIRNNGSDEINEEGAPMFANYGEATQAAFATTIAYARVLRTMAACLFKLNQGDFTEEHFHHEMDFAFNQLENEADQDDENDDE
jgi:hypothetical protein